MLDRRTMGTSSTRCARANRVPQIAVMAGLLIALSACATTTTPTASPCGEGAPEGCEEVVNRVCYVPEIPSTLVQPEWPMSDDVFASLLAGGSSCGFVGLQGCLDGASFGLVSAHESAWMLDGGIVAAGTVDSSAPIGVDVYDAATRLQQGIGFRFPPGAAERVCDAVWYGPREAASCLFDALTLLDTTFPSCTDQVQCDYCACRVNTFNDITSPQCVQPPG